MLSYFTHDNGSRPFRVDVISPHHVALFLRDKQAKGEGDQYQSKPKREWTDVEKVIVGRDYDDDKRTEGNSMLLRLRDETYVYIGTSVKQFKALSPIVKYISHVGNSDIVYPYAIDRAGNYYLIVEDVILTQVPDGVMDVYGWYYYNNEMVPKLKWKGRKILDVTKKDANDWTRTDFVAFYVGGEPSNMRYSTSPGKTFDRIVERHKGDRDNGIQIITKTSFPERVVLDKAEYKRIMQEYGKRTGFQPLKYKLLERRKI